LIEEKLYEDDFEESEEDILIDPKLKTMIEINQV